MFWPIAIMFTQPLASAFCDVWCSRLMNNVFRGLIAPLFYAQVANLIAFPLLFIFGLPSAVELTPLCLIALAVAMNLALMALYLYVLRLIDASVTQALWNLGSAAIPFAGAVIFKESLTYAAVAGFFMVLVSSIFVSMDDFKRPRLNKGFWLMMLVALLWSAWVLVNKAAVEMVGWFNTAFYYKMIMFLFIAGFFIWPRGREIARRDFPKFRRNIKPFAVYGLANNIGLFAGIFALGAMPLVLREGISGTQPFFVLMFAWMLSRIGLSGAKEDMRPISVVKKIVCFAMMLSGLVMLV
ncbi:MAG: hypothetical protein LBQ49_00625 [Rickettsiales bacterium]|jgi:drug/metabolite transporter (DMT)-like permease|nr:hypothetical protein [Rickettsiales bacterium]